MHIKTIIGIIFCHILLFSSCESEKRVTEKSLLGTWKELSQNTENLMETRGVIISEMDSGLYEEEIIINEKNGDSIYSLFSDGCFIELKINYKNEQLLKYLCLGGEFEHAVNMTNKKLKIGNRIFEKYNK